MDTILRVHLDRVRPSGGVIGKQPGSGHGPMQQGPARWGFLILALYFGGKEELCIGVCIRAWIVMHCLDNIMKIKQARKVARTPGRHIEMLGPGHVHEYCLPPSFGKPYAQQPLTSVSLWILRFSQALIKTSLSSSLSLTMCALEVAFVDAQVSAWFDSCRLTQGSN